MRKIILLFLLFVGIALLSGFAGWHLAKYPNFSPLIPQVVKEKARPLDTYTYENLSARDWQPTEIKIESVLDYKPTTVKLPYKFKQYIFSTIVEGKRVTGQINLPNTPIPQNPNNPVPVILMFRGYAPLENYQTGVGTRPSASVFAQNGFITVSPDFFGYGGSDPRSQDEMEARFESYIISLALLKSLTEPNITCALSDQSLCPVLPTITPEQTQPVFLWGHSNGGHLATAALEISGHSPSFAGKVFPTVLWAPVSKSFPYSILVYQDEADDLGKNQRKSLANFEATYDVNLYSVHNYIDWINSPIQIHQGTADEEVPYWWTQEFVKTFKDKHADPADKKTTITEFLYPGGNHSLTPGWDLAVARSLQFFKSHMK